MNTVIKNRDTKPDHIQINENAELNLLLQELNITFEGLENDFTNYSHLFFDLS